MKKKYLQFMSAGLVCTLGLTPQLSLQAQTKGKTMAKKPVIPAVITDVQGEYIIEKKYADSKPGKAPLPPTAPQGAPNVIWVLLDDVGYGACSAKISRTNCWHR